MPDDRLAHARATLPAGYQFPAGGEVIAEREDAPRPPPHAHDFEVYNPCTARYECRCGETVSLEDFILGHLG